MCIFKRILALVLTLALLSTCALSETLRLPESLQRIESEAFSGISSADTVHIPWGTVSIGSLAFADSSISTIYIPDTVTSIADNAFRNTALTIYSAPGTAGHEFALKHDLPWRDCGDYFHQDRMEELNSLLDTSLDDLYMDDSLLLSEEGITDAETLTFIREYNAFVADFYETYTAYNSTIENLYSQMESIPDLVNEFDYCEADGSVSYVTGLGTLIIDENAMGVSAEEVISIQTDEDTHCSTLLTESGAAYYMYVSGGNVRISAEPGVSTLTSRASRSQHEQFISRVNQANTLFSSLDKLFSASIDHLQDLIAHYDQAIEWINHYKTTRMSGTSSAVYQRAEELLKARKASKAQAQSCVSNLKYAKRVFAFINIPSIIANCYVIGEHWARVLDIDGENHPLSMDYTYPEGLRLSREMNTSIQQLCILYAGEALVSIIEVYESLVTIASLVTTIASSISGPAALIPATATLTSLVLSLATVGAEFMLDCIADSIYNSIIDTDEQLHTCVTGIVRDKETGKPLPHVGVVAYTGDISHVNTSNSISGVTDSSGRYTLPLPYGRMNLLFRKAQYEDAQDEVAPVAGQTVTNDDIELDPKNGTLSVDASINPLEGKL